MALPMSRKLADRLATIAPSATLAIGSTAGMNATIGGFGVDDTIDLEFLPYDKSNSTVSIAGGTGADDYVATIDEGGATYSLQFNQAAPMTPGELTLSENVSGGAQLQYNPNPSVTWTWTGADDSSPNYDDFWNDSANWFGDGFTGDIPAGGSKTFTAPMKAGKYPYICSIHQYMTGMLTVS